MSKKKRSYYEPWTAKLTAQAPAPPPAATLTLKGEPLERLVEAYERAVERLPWVLWGSRMADWDLVRSYLTGKRVPVDDQRILLVVHPLPVAPAGGPTHAELAQRVAACVNACAGIVDPEVTLGQVRDLLADLCKGACDAQDNRIVVLLSKMLIPKPFENPDEACHDQSGVGASAD